MVGAGPKCLPGRAAPAYVTLASGSRYHAAIHDGLATVMAAAKLDDGTYSVTDWFQEKGQLIVYVSRETDEMCQP